ncbi:TetR/AcrR family transcriptional regulator [Lactococcus nasutitermitis]|uniref:TetR/AcrR family transcriptional regulator n=1 Tax=Lactococcus nasutitermitis TaxID=1652957 RepID=A0ABV9JEE3_9LACT|nr:TetR/AcrR family transcriptional regulator [Lactococcus nasutitermitis]
MKTKEKILQVAEKLVMVNGFGNVTLSEIAQNVGISAAALYKHFKNKEELWLALAKNYTDKISAKLFPFEVADGATQAQIVHDWLWALCEGKFLALQTEPEMFALYTEFLEDKTVANQEHSRELMASFAQATGIENRKEIRTLFDIFAKVMNPYFVAEWDEDYQEKFERIWMVVKGFYE